MGASRYERMIHKLRNIKSLFGTGLIYLLAGILMVLPLMSYAQSNNAGDEKGAEIDETDALPEIKLGKPVS